HRTALTHDASEPKALLVLCTQIGVFRLQPALLERRVEPRRKIVAHNWLADEIPSAMFARLDGVLVGTVAGDDDGDDVGIALDGGFDDDRAVDAGQAEIGDNDVESELTESRERRLARIGLLDQVTAIAELLSDSLAKRGFVLDEEQMFRGLRHLARRQHIDTSGAACPGI